VALTRARKAAILLTSLDPVTAAELLRAAQPELLTEIAAELVSLESAGSPVSAAADSVKDFCTLIHRPQASEANPAAMARRLLESAVGKEKGEAVMTQARRLADGRDPFRFVREASPQELAPALAGEHPQVATLVLMELPAAKSAVLITLLEEGVRAEAVRRMTCGDTVLPETKTRVAALIRSKLEAARRQAAADGAPVASATAAGPAGPAFNPRLRQVGLLLRGLAAELRDALVKSIAEGNAETAKTVQDLMVMWEDIPQISERNLQEVLRNVDARKLALSLVKAEPAIDAKIRANISERARVMIDEEAQLMKKPKPDEVMAAREAVLGYLRQLNATGELQFEEG
jgi:flagellar motor switch protein FliG